MTQVNLTGFGFLKSADVASAKTLALSDCGIVQNVTGDVTVTLEATVVGTVHIVRVGARDVTVKVSPNASDKIAGNGFTATDNKDVIFTNAPVGSYVELVADGVNGWMIGKLYDPAGAFSQES